MKILIIADSELKEEIESQPFSGDAEIEWISMPADFHSGNMPDGCIDLLFENTKERKEWLKQLPAPIIINSVITTLDEIKEDFVRINGWPTFLKRPLAEAACKNDLVKQKAELVFSQLERKIEWVPDITGLITPRIIASIINEAFVSVEEKVSTEEQIDIAMKLGVNYPYGPFEWSKKIGLKKISSLLEALSKEESRYQPCDLLKQKASA